MYSSGVVEVNNEQKRSFQKAEPIAVEVAGLEVLPGIRIEVNQRTLPVRQRGPSSIC